MKALLGLLGLGSAFFILFAAAGATAQDDLSDARIVRYFDLIALRSEYRDVRNPRIARWDGPIRLFIEKDVAIAPRVEAGLRRHMAHLSRLTGVSVAYVGDPRNANFLIVYTRLERFPLYVERFLGGRSALAKRLSQRAHCAGFYGTDRKSGAINQARAVIPVDHARERGVLYACTIEETTQLMGLPNDDDGVLHSIFNDRSVYQDLTPLDELLLRILYHPRMRPGTPRARALVIASEIVPRLRRR